MSTKVPEKPRGAEESRKITAFFLKTLKNSPEVIRIKVRLMDISEELRKTLTMMDLAQKENITQRASNTLSQELEGIQREYPEAWEEYLEHQQALGESHAYTELYAEKES